jgi:outer membrane protein OmpA-like peptidoglycan-associated protein
MVRRDLVDTFLYMLPTFLPRRLAIAFTFALVVPLRLTAQELPPSIRNAAACAPVPVAAQSDAPRIVGGRDPAPKTLFGAGDLVVIDAGTASAKAVGQQYFVRRSMKAVKGPAPRAQETLGWLTIVAATDRTAIALIDFACADVVIGDHLEPYAAPVLPPGIERTDARGELDFSLMSHVVLGDKGRSTGGVGDFMIADIGQKQGVAPGTRFGIFRDVYRSNQVPLVTIGEAIALSVSDDQSVIRLTESRDAIGPGDFLVQRKPVPEPATPPAPPSAPAQTTLGDDEETLPTTAGKPEPGTLVRDFAFEDVHFDFDRFTLRPEAAAILDQAVAALQRDPTLRLQIEGHTCNIGTAEYNLALGDRRAQAVRDHLTSRGIAAERLTTVSYGEERPKHDNSQEETRRLNRRAVLVVNVQR